MPENSLTTVLRDQLRWSLTADMLKASIEQSRRVTLGLAIVGAILETGGAQIDQSNPGLAKVFGYAGAAVLAIAGVIRQWKLGHERTQSWILSRAASESFKREIYLFRTSAGPYASLNPALTLLNRREEILAKVQPCLKYRIEPKADLETPGPLNIDSYLDMRITGERGQIKYFTRGADRYATAQSRLNGAMFSLALIAALLGTALTMTGKQAYGAWVAVITTISGALVAHTLAQRYEQLIISFRATADRLASTVNRWGVKGTGSLPELVETCEAVLLEENQGWIAGADQTAAPPSRAAATNL